MACLFWVSEETWVAIDPHPSRGKPGKLRVDDRRAICGIRHVLKTGCRRRDVPCRNEPPTTIYNRCNEWSRRGPRQRLFERVTACGEVPPEHT
jgi:transposase